MRDLKSLRFRRHRELGHRSRGIAAFFVSSVASRGLGVGCQLLQVPLALHTLGPESFGLWMTMVSLSNIMLYADLGLGVGLQNRLAEAFAGGRDDEARSRFATIFALLLLVALVFVIGGSALFATTDLTALFNLTDPTTINEAPAALFVFWLIFCAGFPLGLGQRLAYAHQEGWRHNVAQAAGNVLGLGAVALAAQQHASLGWFIAGVQGSLVLAYAVLLTDLFRRLGWRTREGFRVQWRHVRDMLGLGACFSVQQVLTMVLFSVPQLVISTVLGAAAVTPFNLAQRFFNLFAVAQNAFMLPLWPAYSNAFAKSDFSWIRRTFRRSVKATLLLSVIPMLVGSFFALPFIRLWVGDAGPLPGPALIALLFCFRAIIFLQQPCGFLLAGVSEIGRITLYHLISGPLCVALMIWWAEPFGALGIAAALIAGYAPFSFLGTVLEARRFLRRIGPADRGGFDSPGPARLPSRREVIGQT